MREGNIFSVHICRGYPHPAKGVGMGYPLPRSGLGGTPIWLMEGTLWYPHPQDWDGGTPIQTWKGIPPSRPGMGVPPPPSRPGRGYPHPDLGWGTPPIQVRSKDRGYPLPDQHSVYLLRSGRYASSVYAGGLSSS